VAAVVAMRTESKTPAVKAARHKTEQSASYKRRNGMFKSCNANIWNSKWIPSKMQ